MTREELNQEKQQEILNEDRHEKRKKVTLVVFKLILAIVVVFLTFYLYTTFVSTRIMSVREYRIINNKLPKSFDGIKVIQFSDLHYGTTIFEKDLEKIVNEINRREPDLVVFTGDLIDINYSLKIEEQEKIIKQLKRINSTLGKYAIYGEEDSILFSTIMKQGDFDILDNSYDLIYKDDRKPILLIGLGSLLNNNSNINSGFSYFSSPTHNANIFSITLAHEPDIINNILNNHSTDLLLSGHSHNGNVRIPFLGGIYKVDGAQKFDQEYYKISNTELFVSSGLGTNGPGFRLFCRPSINFFRISSK